jgi:hypothetical protein
VFGAKHGFWLFERISGKVIKVVSMRSHFGIPKIRKGRGPWKSRSCNFFKCYGKFALKWRGAREHSFGDHLLVNVLVTIAIAILSLKSQGTL